MNNIQAQEALFYMCLLLAGEIEEVNSTYMSKVKL